MDGSIVSRRKIVLRVSYVLLFSAIGFAVGMMFDSIVWSLTYGRVFNWLWTMFFTLAFGTIAVLTAVLLRAKTRVGHLH